MFRIFTLSFQIILVSLLPVLATAQLFPVRHDGNWGLMDPSGELSLAADFDAIRDIRGDHAVFVKDGQFGLVNGEGDILIPASYDFLQEGANGLVYLAKKDSLSGKGHWGLRHLPSGTELEIAYDLVDTLRFGVLRLNKGGNCALTECKGGKWGLADSTGLLIAPAVYEEFSIRSRGEAFMRGDSGWGRMDLRGNILIPPRYASLNRVRPGELIMELDERFGLLNDSGVVRIPASYEKLEYSGFGFYSFQQGGKWGLIDSAGTVHFEARFDQIEARGKGWVAYREKKYWGLYRMSGERISLSIYNSIQAVLSTRAIVERDFLIGMIDTLGNRVIPYRYESLVALDDTLLMGRIKKGYQWFDLDGKPLRRAYYDYLEPFRNNVARFRSFNKWGLINIRGINLMPARYEKILTHRTAARGLRRGEWDYCYYDKTGAKTKVRKLVLMRRDEVDRDALLNPTPGLSSLNALGWFYSSGKQLWGLRNPETKSVLIKPKYNGVRTIPGTSLSVASFQGENDPAPKWGIVDHVMGVEKGDFVFAEIFENELMNSSVGRATLSGSGRYCLITREGEAITFDKSGYIGPFKEGRARINLGGRLVWEDNPGLESLETERSFDRALGRWGFTYLYCRGGKWGFIDTLGNWSKESTYEVALDFQDGHARIRQMGKWGVVDRNYEEVVKPQYDFIEQLYHQDGRRLYKVGTEVPACGLIDRRGTVVLSPQYDDVGPVSDGVFAFLKGNLWGFASTSGRELIAPSFMETGNFHEGRARVRNLRLWGFIDLNGNAVTPQKYLRAGDFSNGLARVQEGRAFGFLDTLGKLVIPAVYSQAEDFSEGLAAVMRKGRFGLINPKGKWVIPPRYYKVYPFKDSIARIQEKGNFGLINVRGEFIIRPGFKEIGDFSEGLARARERNAFGYIDRNGEEVIPSRFPNCGDFSEGLAPVFHRGKWGFVDSTGQLVIDARFSKVYGFQEGRAAVKLNGKWGFADQNGNLVVSAIYDLVRNYQQGRAAVFSFDGGWGFVDASGMPVISCQYDAVTDFGAGRARVMSDQKWGVINLYGSPITLIKYDEVGDFNEGFAKIRLERRLGLVDEKGTVVLDSKYDTIELKENLIQVEQNDQVGYLAPAGDWVWPLSK